MIINKVTKLYAADTITDEQIQAHLDYNNSEGWQLLAVDNLMGWYRFFWTKHQDIP